MSQLLLPHILNYFRNKLNDSLRISDFEDIVEVELGFVFLEPLPPSVIHLLHNRLHLIFVEWTSHWLPITTEVYVPSILLLLWLLRILL